MWALRRGETYDYRGKHSNGAQIVAICLGKKGIGLPIHVCETHNTRIKNNS